MKARWKFLTWTSHKLLIGEARERIKNTLLGVLEERFPKIFSGLKETWYGNRAYFSILAEDNLLCGTITITLERVIVKGKTKEGPSRCPIYKPLVKKAINRKLKELLG